MCSTVSFNYLKANHWISPKQVMDQALILMTSDIQSYNFPGLNYQMSDKPLSKSILDKDSGLMYGELHQTLAYMAQNDDTEFHGNEEGFQ